MGSGHFVRFWWRNPLTEFVLFTFLTCSDQVRFLSIMMPKYLACSTAVCVYHSYNNHGHMDVTYL